MKPQPITSIDELLKHNTPYRECTPVILFDRSLWQKFVAAVTAKKRGAVVSRALVVAVAALTLWVIPADSMSHGEAADLKQMRAVLVQCIAEMDHRGRLPLNGVAGGMLNNVWQTVSHPSNPALLGCGWQATYVHEKLAGTPGWRFEQRFELGLSSPILLPHQWLTAYGPDNRVIEIDPWLGVTELSRGSK